MSESSERKMKSPFEKAGVWSLATYAWLNELIQLGSKKALEASDIPPLPQMFRCHNVKKYYGPVWERDKQKDEPFIGYSLVYAFGFNFIVSGLYFLPYIGITLLQPYFVTSLLQYVSTGHSEFLGIDSGIGQAIVLGVLSIISVFAVSISFYYTSLSALPIRSSVISMVFEKSLKLSSSARSVYTMGTFLFHG